MTIEKNGKIYAVRENKHSWSVSTTIGGVDILYNVPKDNCATFDALKTYVNASELF